MPPFPKSLAAPLLLAALGAATACGRAALEAPAPPAAEIPALEATLARDSSDVDAALLLASAYRAAGRSEDARLLLENGRVAGVDDPGVLLLLALAYEDLERWREARELYQAYQASGPAGAIADEVALRLEQVGRAELDAAVRDALAREAQLGATQPSPSTVGVFPFAYAGADPAWEPLSLALAELLATDLGVTGRLQVVERVRVQRLLDEIAVGEAGMTEVATAARSGRLLGAGRIVQGRYQLRGEDLVVDAAVVVVGGAEGGRVQPVSGEERAERLLDLEKRLALQLHADLGISLTPAERERIEERPTESVQALLAFGRGLAALDRGDFEQAESFFEEATGLDPSFSLAQRGRERSQRVARAGRSPGFELSTRATRMSRARRQVEALRRLPPTARQHVLRSVGTKRRAVLAEVLGQDRLGNSILLELIFVPPGGTP